MKIKEVLNIIGMGCIVVAVFFIYKCPFKYFFSISCPGCGMTRAIKSFVQGRVKEAFYYHPLFPVAIVAAIVYILLYLGKIKIKDKKLNRYIMLLSILFLGVFIIRIICHSDILQFDFYSSIVYGILVRIKESLHLQLL